MTHEPEALRANGDLQALSSPMLNSDPAGAVRQAREIDLTSSARLNAMPVRAAIPVEGGAATGQQDTIEEGLELFRGVYAAVPEFSVAYNLAPHGVVLDIRAEKMGQGRHMQPQQRAILPSARQAGALGNGR